MREKQKSIPDVLNGESGRKILEEVKAESYEGDLLNLISNSSKGEVWTNLGRPPEAQEIDSARTSEEMIIENRAILRGGRKIYWLSS
jgi:hypothetical protein